MTSSIRTARPAAHSCAAARDRGKPADRRRGGVLRGLRLVLLGMLVGVASGCASYLTAQVTSFHDAGDRRLAGRGFVITPTKEQAESLEFRAYADLVANALVREGLVAAADGDAELEVTMRYGVDSGSPVTYGYPAYGYASYGPVWGWQPYPAPGGRVHYVWTATYPMSYGVVGTNYAQTVLYRRELRVEINDRRAGPNGARVFEGTAVSEGESASLAPVMPAMVRALFNDFPGPNGVSRRVTVNLDAPPPAAPAAPPAPPQAR